MKLSIREYMVPGATLAEKVRKLEQYGFDGIEITGTTDIKEKA
ncbi:MAG: sugar phosphate isomerase/epimerase, partial [Planctomycetes bacterium]|nr:sugar phosphate isomerase/epimerase [Planctomycetota bacterium]